jgi:putative ABC transport system permease protein
VIRHLLKLVWNRKRANALIITEIFLSFLVIFAVLIGVIAFATNWRLPLGYDYREVWDIEMGFDIDAADPENAELRDTVRRLVAEAKSFPEVEVVAGSNTPPYSFNTTNGTWHINGKEIDMFFDDVTDGFGEVMRVPATRGRWFSAEDDAQPYQPVVITDSTARELYGNENPIGKKFDPESAKPQQIVGTIAAFRKDGEMSRPINMVFRRVSLQRPMGRLGHHLLLRVRPGTSVDFEARLMKRLQGIAPAMSMKIARMERMRTQAHRLMATPLVIGAILALFLISMVALGLTGILWQSVTRRTREIGVRRAMGASGGGVNAQILLEVMLLTTLALFVGVIVVWQLPLLGIFGVVPPPVFTTAFIVSLIAIYAITLTCGLYPSWLASRLTPADALRYE